VLLYLESSSGHGGGTTVTRAIERSADIYAFLIENLGMKATQQRLARVMVAEAARLLGGS
jgi:hypothetical protein